MRIKIEGLASLLIVLLVTIAGPLAPVRAQVQDGIVIPVASSRLMETSQGLVSQIERQLDRWKKLGKEGAGFWVIFDFNPEDKPVRSDSYGACYELARQIRDLKNRGVQSVAFVHGKVSGHLVLPALACNQIVMSENPPSLLGPVSEPGKALLENERKAYEEFCLNRYSIPLVQKMFDPDLLIEKVKNSNTLEQYQVARGIPVNPVPDLGRNQLATYDRPHALEYGFCQSEPRNNLSDLLASLGLPRSILDTPIEHPVVWQMSLSGSINGELLERTKRHIRTALGQKANILVLKLECGNGDSLIAYQIGHYLSELNTNRKDNPVQTIAYVYPNSRNNAAYIALGCDRIFLHPDATLGEFDRYLQENATLQTGMANNIADLARRKQYPEVIARGLVDPDLRIVSVRDTAGNRNQIYLDEQTMLNDNRASEEKKTGPRWIFNRLVKPVDKATEKAPLTLHAPEALEFGIATQIADSPNGILETIGVDARDVKTAENDFLDDLAQFLRHPYTRVFLVMIGIAALILEVKIPGVTLPGVIAAICFVLFFWSHSQIHGEITVLALLLFLLGLLLLGLEIFVIPGFGACGLGGIMLVISSLGLIAYGQIPRSGQEWNGFTRTITQLGFGMSMAIALAFSLAHYLPRIPYVNRLILKPGTDPDPESAEQGIPAGNAGDLPFLVGTVGVALTPLRPSGKARFDNRILDVVTDGGYVPPGNRVRLIEIDSYRIVVKEVDGNR